MGFRKTAFGNRDKNIVILERNYLLCIICWFLLGRCILVRKVTGNKTFQPAPLQTTYFQRDKKLFSLLPFNRRATCIRNKKNLTRKGFQRSKILEYSPVRSYQISHVLTCGAGWICQTSSTREKYRASTLPFHLPIATLFVSLLLRQFA